MPDDFFETPVSITLKGRIYYGTYRVAAGSLFVNSRYGSKVVPIGKARAGSKEAARLVLKGIIQTRGDHNFAGKPALSRS